MSGIIRRTYHPAQLSSLFSDLDPFRVMEGLFRVAPSAEGAQRQLEFAPSFDVKETKEAFLFKAESARRKEIDLRIAHTGNRLTIGGKREAEERKEGENYFMVERSYGSFQRSFTLPESADVDQIKAELVAGVLSIKIPKRVAAQPRKISVSLGDDKKN